MWLILKLFNYAYTHTILTGSSEHARIGQAMDFNIENGHKRRTIKDTWKYGQDAATVTRGYHGK